MYIYTYNLHILRISLYNILYFYNILRILSESIFVRGKIDLELEHQYFLNNYIILFGRHAEIHGILRPECG